MGGSKHQIASGEQFEDVDDNGYPCYRVNVQFSGGMFGSFSQWVAFDFGTKPVLLRKLNVELGDETVHEKVKLGCVRLHEKVKLGSETVHEKVKLGCVRLCMKR